MTREILIKMCIEFLDLLDRLYNKGQITSDQYDEYSKLKIEFLRKHMN